MQTVFEVENLKPLVSAQFDSLLTLYKVVASISPLKDTVTETGNGKYFATIDQLNFVFYLFIVCVYRLFLSVGVSVCYGKSAAVFK